MRTVLPLAGSHNRTVFPLPEASTLPCGDQDMELTGRSFPVNRPRLLPLTGSHKRMVSLPEAIILPSADQDNDQIASSCPLKVCRDLPLSGSHKRAVRSWLPDASVLNQKFVE